MAEAFYPDGSPVPEAQLGDAIASGQARWKKGDVVSFSTPTGERYDVPAESAWDALGRGWVPESEHEQKLRDYKARAGVAETLQAFGESALSTATIGLSDVVLGDEDSRLAREASPLATTLGEAAGLITPMGVEAALARGGARGVVGIGAQAVTAPTRGVSRFARGAGNVVEGLLPQASSVTGRAGRSALRYGAEGAIEGGAFGAGRELSRQSLGEEQLSVEKILSAAGEGALFGGVVGGGVGGIGRVLGEGFAKASQRGIGGTRFAEQKALQASGALGGDLNKITQRFGDERLNRIGRELLDRELITPTDSLAQRARKIGAAKDEVGAEIGSLYTRLDDAGAVFDSAGLKKRLADYLGKLRSEGVGPDIRLAREIERDWAVSLTGATSFQRIHKALQRLDEEIYGELGKVRKARLQAVRAEVKDAIRDEVARAAPDEGLRLAKLDQAFSDLKLIGDVSKKRVGQVAGNRTISLTDTIAGAAGLAVGGPGGLALAFANKALRSERTDAALAQALYKMRGSADDSALALSSAIQKSARDGASKAAFELPAKAANVTKEFIERSEAAQQFVTNPSLASARLEHVVAPLHEADPVLASRAATTLADDLAWLAQRAPKTPLPVMLSALTGKNAASRVPQSQAASFTRTAKALANPVEAVSEMKSGRLAPETVDVLRERRPALREAVTREVISAATTMARKGEEPSYAWKIQGSLLTGIPLDHTMTPGFMRAAAAVWQAEREAQPAEQPAPRRVTPNRIRERLSEQRTGSEKLVSGELEG